MVSFYKIWKLIFLCLWDGRDRRKDGGWYGSLIRRAENIYGPSYTLTIRTAEGWVKYGKGSSAYMWTRSFEGAIRSMALVYWKIVLVWSEGLNGELRVTNVSNICDNAGEETWSEGLLLSSKWLYCGMCFSVEKVLARNW